MLLIKRFSLIVALSILCLCSLAEVKTVQSDASEIFSLNVNQDETVQFFYVGYQSIDIKPGTNNSFVQTIKGSAIQQTLKPYVLSGLEIL